MAEMTAPVAVGDRLTVTIEGYAAEGEGVGRYEGFTVFVPQTLVGERVETEIELVKKNYARGRLLALQEASPHRVDPACSLYTQCGGCQLLHLSYEGQLTMKRQRVVDTLQRIGGLAEVTVHPVIGMAEPWHYRNKVQYPFGLADNRIVVGCYQKGTHRVVPTDTCAIQHELNSKVMQAVRKLAQKYKLTVYDERTGEGFLRHVLVKNAFGTGEVMVVLVTNDAEFAKGPELAQALAKACPAVKSVVQNINTTRGNTVLGSESRTLWGADRITDRLGDLEFKISANSFFQVNPKQTEVLYEKAVEYAGLTGKETVLDAYCGVGSLTLFLARRAKEVYGVEAVEPAIRDAEENAAHNGIANVRFIVGRTEKVLPKLAAIGTGFDVAVVDPPRAGCDPEVLKTMAKVGVGRVVYVSCNPSTLARDLKILAELGYVTKEVQPVDMFPHTFHVECVTLMSRVEE
ncbi:MAG TPA: 23S rRNA (uracil(1939)-C(5))-methyltransferase RlmD [Firmicutes bacterium]|nr:23S rRNA (uracil(1939)-C(5))-methyltransferase RlmD [Bacillota bacterium]